MDRRTMLKQMGAFAVIAGAGIGASTGRHQSFLSGLQNVQAANVGRNDQRRHWRAGAAASVAARRASVSHLGS